MKLILVNYLYNKIFYNQMLHFNDYQNKINKFAKKSNLVIYGAGTLGKVTSQALKKYDIEVDFFCDSDKRKYHLKTEKKKKLYHQKNYKVLIKKQIYLFAIYILVQLFLS